MSSHTGPAFVRTSGGTAGLRRLRAWMRGRLIEVGGPGIVAIEPAGVAVAFAHPRIRARDRLHDGCAGLVMRLVTPERTLDVLALHRIKTARKNGGILD